MLVIIALIVAIPLYIYYEQSKWFWTFVVLFFVFLIVHICINAYKSRHYREIMAAKVERASVCPRCGSRDVSWSKKGYDYNKAYWYSLLGLKGGRYIAGQQKNRIVCHCNNCGKDWQSDLEKR